MDCMPGVMEGIQIRCFTFKLQATHKTMQPYYENI